MAAQIVTPIRDRPIPMPWAILRLMRLRSITPIVMTLAICFAPIALDVCQAACVTTVTPGVAGPGSHDHGRSQHHASTSGHQHASGCHEAVAAPDGSARRMHGLPNTCSHTDQLPESAGACSPLLVSSPAVIATTVDLAVPTIGRLSRSERFHSTVSLRISATTQLRV
jgi:hypothetical protein